MGGPTWGHGFLGAAAKLNYLSSLLFRQSFTETFHEAIFFGKPFGGLHHQAVVHLQPGPGFFQRIDNFQSAQPGDSIIIRKAAGAGIFQPRTARSQTPFCRSGSRSIPARGLLRRTQPAFSNQAVRGRRADFQPRVTTSAVLEGIPFSSPASRFAARHWGESQPFGNDHRAECQSRFRARKWTSIWLTPTFARVFKKEKLFSATSLKHVIEPRASFRKRERRDPIFEKLIRFDETELLSDTTEVEISLTNRLYAKRGGEVSESAELGDQAAALF